MQLQVTAIRQQSALIIIYSPDSSGFCIYIYMKVYISSFNLSVWRTITKYLGDHTLHACIYSQNNMLQSSFVLYSSYTAC